MIYQPGTEKLLTGLIKFLTKAVPLRSHSVIIPPGFGSSEFSAALQRALLAHESPPLVALVSADGLRTPSDFVRSLAEEWGNQDEQLEVIYDADPRTYFGRLLRKINPTQRPVLIINEFQKILGRLDEDILVALRDAEQAGRIQTVAVSIFPHQWIREKWKKEGHLLHVSNYGDSHKEWRIQKQNHNEFLSSSSLSQFPGWFKVLLWDLTAGFPLPVQHLIDKWKEYGEPKQPSEVLEDELRTQAVNRFQRLVSNLEQYDESRFRELLLEIHQHRRGAGEAITRFKRHHPWAYIIINEEGLCTDSIGEAVLAYKLKDLFHQDKDSDFDQQVLEFSKEQYENGYFEAALKGLDRVSLEHLPSAMVMRMNCRIMSSLRPSDLKPSLDTNWSQVEIEAKKGILEAQKLSLPEMLCETLLHRYTEISEFALLIKQLLRAEDKRTVDMLAGLRSEQSDPNTAFTLLVLQYDAGVAISGNTLACKAVSEIPEQVFRCWAYWRHGINFYETPVVSEEERSKIEELWPESRLGKLKLPKKAGEVFPSILAFSFYLQAIVPEQPWDNTKALLSEMSIFQLRNDSAHATSVLDAGCRRRLFGFIHEWLLRIERDCPSVTICIESARRIVEPLPNLD